MKKYLVYIGCFLMLASMPGCNDFLDKDPLDKLTNESYWVDETSLRAYSQDFYSTYFVGYAQDYRAFGGYFSGDSYNDDFLLTSDNVSDTDQRLFFPTTNTTGINGVTTTWDDQYKIVRKANVMLEKIPNMDITDEAKEHWMGIGRFFRALAYSTLVKTYGGVPYIDYAVDPADLDVLYKDRDDQVTVVNKILEDYDYALKHVRVTDGTRQVNKYVVGAYMSRNMLYHATWLKYHGTTVGTASQAVPNTELSKFFKGAIDGAQEVLNSGQFSIGNTYNALFTTDNLAGNGEVIFYREYTSGVATNAIMAYNAKEDQRLGGATIDAIESYLCLDGLPIGQSPNYQGATDPSIESAFKDRDPRLYDTFVDSLRILNSGLHPASSPTGFASKKFLNEDWLAADSPYVTGLLSPADAPVIRYAEVLLNYVEARYEISKVGGDAFAQADLDKSINEIRKRVLTKWGESPAVNRKLPTVTLSGNNLSVNGTIINDPVRDSDVDPILWEIRRERRIELMMEGRRSEDLNRWAKFEYLNTGAANSPTKKVLGAWINKSDYPGIEAAVKLFDPANPSAATPTKGYIAYYAVDEVLRAFTKGDINSEKNYLRAIPVAQITIYKDKGYTLTQNPGWE
jgi:hypothetical protein